jgi:hypothetical protein
MSMCPSTGKVSPFEGSLVKGSLLGPLLSSAISMLLIALYTGLCFRTNTQLGH